MRMKDVKDLRDLREMNTNDVIDVLDELRAVASKRGAELLGRGRVQAQRAMGAPNEGAVPSAFLAGVVLGAALGAAVAMLMAPWEGREARRRVREQMERARDRVPEMRLGGDGRSVYERAEGEDRPTNIGPTGLVS